MLMSFEGNLAENLPAHPDRQEEDKKSDAELLRELRIKQMNGEVTEKERLELLKLQEKEAENKTGIESVSEQERNRFRELSIKQTNQEMMSDSDSEELAFLYDRMECQK